jgi:hypothetical protein
VYIQSVPDFLPAHGTALAHFILEAHMQTARYVRLYTDQFGETHFEGIEVPLSPQDFTDEAVPLQIAQFMPVSSSFCLSGPGDWSGDVSGPTSRRLILCTVEGEYQMTVSDGEVCCFPAGSVLFLDNTTGKGHLTSINNKRGVLVFAMSIDENERRKAH